MSESTALAKSAPRQMERPKQTVVIARSAEDLLLGNQQLIGWAQDRIDDLEVDLADTVKNLEHATKRKWKVSPWKRRVTMLRKRLNYYVKIKAALEQGYCMVPNFPAHVFAIRTCKKNPRKNTARGTWRNPSVKNQNTESPPLGEGRHVDPNALQTTWQDEVDDGKGGTKTVHYAEAVEFDDPEFPVTMVKPQILEDVSHARALKIFDEIGMLPEPRRHGADPVVVGRIVLQAGTYSERAMTFLLSWWVDRQDF